MLKLPTFDMYNCFAVRIYACCTIFVKLCSGIVAIQVQFPFDKSEKHLSLLQMHGTNNKYKYPKKMKCHFYEFRLHHPTSDYICHRCRRRRPTKQLNATLQSVQRFRHSDNTWILFYIIYVFVQCALHIYTFLHLTIVTDFIRFVFSTSPWCDVNSI